jgi:O-antigen/teichoic acid export membrane protein
VQQAFGPLIITCLGPLRSRLYTNTGYLWLDVCTVALQGFAFWAVVARLYSPEAVGVGGTALSSILILAQVSQLGLGYALIRHIPQSRQKSVQLLSRSLLGVAVASLIAGLIFLVTIPLWSHELKHLLWQDAGNAIGFVVVSTFVTVLGLLRFIFVAYSRGVYVLLLHLATGFLRIPAAVLLVGLGSASGIVAGYGAASLVGVLLGLWLFLPKCTGYRWLPLMLDVGKLRPIVPFALSNLVSHVITVMAWQLLPLPIIALAGATAAGFLYVAWSVAGIALMMMQQLALSLFAESSNDSRSFKSQARGALLVGVMLGGLFTVLVYFLGDLVLLLFGGEYVGQSSSVLKVLTAATPLAAITYVYLGVERVRQRLAPLVGVSVIVTVVMLGTIVALVPRVGIVGAGYGVVAGYGAGALISLLLLYPMMKQSHRPMGVGQSIAP